MATSLSPTSSATTCRYCGNHVSDRYSRVFGDTDGHVHRCPECDSQKRLYAGSAAGKDVDWPDPVAHPERDGGEDA